MATVGTTICVVATDGGCAGLIPSIYTAVGAADYAIAGGKHTLGGYAKAMGEGLVVGGGALLCAALCAEATALFVTVGGTVAVLGGTVGAFDYVTSNNPRNWGGFWEAFALGTVENGPYPIDRLFGFAK